MARTEPRLQRTLLAWLLGPLLLLLAVDSGVTWWTSLRFSNLAHDRSLHEIGREIVLHVRNEGGALHLQMPPETEKVLLVDQDDHLFYRIATADGRVLGGDPSIGAPAAPVPGGRPVFRDGTVRDVPVRMMAAWMTVGDGPGAPAVQVQVAETLNKRNRLAREILANVVLPQLLLILLASGAVYVGVSRGLQPLARLRAAVSDRSHRDLSPIGLEGVPGEVRPLVEEVNDLMARLGSTIDFQSRFVADAAHQLKTPVSGLKAQIELALREEDPARVRHSLAQLYLGADRLSRLVRQLLLLARNEPGAAESVQFQPLDLNAFALDISMEWVPQALRGGVDLGFEGHDAPLMIEGDPERLRELCNNLIDNAIRYSHRGGRVTVAVTRQAEGHCRLAVSDDGPRIPVEERERIFGRFHRLLGAPADGSGLGLAIVSEIASLHGASITLEEDVDGVGNTFSVIFRLL